MLEHDVSCLSRRRQVASVVFKLFLLLCLVTCWSFVRQAQADPYYLPEWAAGSNVGNALGIYGVKGEAATTSHPGGREWGSVLRDADGNLLFFGGYGWGKYQYGSMYMTALGPLNDVWKYDVTTGTWTWVAGDDFTWGTGAYDTQNARPALPSGRYGMARWVEASGDVLFFGGWGYDWETTYDFLAETWRWKAADKAWELVRLTGKGGEYGTQGVPSADTHPGARMRSMTWKAADGAYWLFGGLGYATDDIESGALNDLWKYDPVTAQWTWAHGANTLDTAGVYGQKGVPDPANMPGGRLGAAQWVDGAGNLWLFGGGECSPFSEDYVRCLTVRNDLWKYDPVANTWTWMSGSDEAGQSGVYGELGVPAAANVPGARMDAASWLDGDGNLWLFGGVSQDLATTGTITLDTLPFNDLWKYDVATGLWTWMQGSASVGEASVYGTQGLPAATNRLGAREGAEALAGDDGMVWLFGGAVWPNTMNYEALGDLWRLHPPLAAPQLGFRGVAPTAFNLFWASVDYATSYVLTVARDAAFTDIVPGYDGVAVMGNALAVMGLRPRTVYYARAKARNALRESGFSGTLVVRTLPVSTAVMLPLLGGEETPVGAARP
jgi:hypothetical protein